MESIDQKRPRWRGWLFRWLCPAYLLAIFGLPSAVAFVLARNFAGAVFAVPAWAVAFLLVAGVLSLPHQFAVRPGKFRCDVRTRMYFHRRMYGLCWTAVYYNKPVYFLCLSIPLLKRITFRLFGYRGSMNFTIYPDTWIRDLPVLRFADGAYISNRATLGTNIIFKNGFILVGPITLGEKALVGHLSMIGPGVKVESNAEIGVGSVVGISATIEESAFIGPCSGIGHGARIGRRASIGHNSVIDSGAQVGDAELIAACTNIKRAAVAKCV
jgi:carbonic anhydrase/acetyltransferase-like protein (isoleucine patch superfamily)